MSKTDKTNPWFVKKRDPRLVHLFEELPGQFREWPNWWIGESKCGCPWCADTKGRRVETRKKRRQGRKEARDWWREN